MFHFHKIYVFLDVYTLYVRFETTLSVKETSDIYLSDFKSVAPKTNKSLKSSLEFQFEGYLPSRLSNAHLGSLTETVALIRLEPQEKVAVPSVNGIKKFKQTVSDSFFKCYLLT